MKKLLLVAAALAAVIQPATAQTTQTVCQTSATRTVCTTITIPAVQSLLTPSQQRTAYGSRTAFGSR